MRTKKYKVFLTQDERKQLEKIISSGKSAARLIRRAHILLALDENTKKVPTQAEIAAMYGCSCNCVAVTARQYVEEGLERVLTRKKREVPPVAPKITGDVEAQVSRIACSQPPEGRAKWTLRLIQEKTIELEIIDEISHTSIATILKKLLKTPSKKNVVYST